MQQTWKFSLTSWASGRSKKSDLILENLPCWEVTEFGLHDRVKYGRLGRSCGWVDASLLHRLLPLHPRLPLHRLLPPLLVHLLPLPPHQPVPLPLLRPLTDLPFALLPSRPKV